jgi:hypothetical protein
MEKPKLCQIWFIKYAKILSIGYSITFMYKIPELIGIQMILVEPWWYSHIISNTTYLLRNALNFSDLWASQNVLIKHFVPARYQLPSFFKMCFHMALEAITNLARLHYPRVWHKKLKTIIVLLFQSREIHILSMLVLSHWNVFACFRVLMLW